jgi:hypothetical protein
MFLKSGTHFGCPISELCVGTDPAVGRWAKNEEQTMADNNPSTGFLGAVLGGLIALAAIVFIVTGGELGGTKKVESDADLPPVASPAPKPGTTGSK